jgi:hypothetical protein
MLPIGNGSDACGLDPARSGSIRLDRARSSAIQPPWAVDVAGSSLGRAGRGQGRAHYNHEHLYVLGLTDD